MSVYSNSIDQNFLPNLPGFRPHTLKTGAKKQYFNIVNGQIVEKESVLPMISNGDMDDASVNSIGNSTASLNKRRSKLGDENLTLTFQAYFEEHPIGSNSTQIRKCNIYFFTEDGSLKIVEKPQLNSGVSQGTLVRRAVIPKSDGSVISEYDLVIGEDLIVYGRSYRYDTFLFTLLIQFSLIYILTYLIIIVWWIVTLPLAATWPGFSASPPEPSRCLQTAIKTTATLYNPGLKMLIGVNSTQRRMKIRHL